MKNILIFGITDFAEVVYENINRDLASDQEVIGFIVDDSFYKKKKFCGLPVYKFSDIHKIHKEVGILVCVGYKDMNIHRKRIFGSLLHDGRIIANYIAKDSIVLTQDLGMGNIILSGVNIGEKCKIGDGNVFFNGALIGHHTIVGDFNFFSVSVSVAGCVHIGDYCFFGNNSSTCDHIEVFDRTIVGGGTYLSKSTRRSQEVYAAPKAVLLPKCSNEVQF